MPCHSNRWHRRSHRAGFVCVVAAWMISQPLPAQVLDRHDPRAPVAVSPEQDDATLHDVAFVGTQLGVAVGDRGVTWHSTDGGLTWEFRPAPTRASLRCVQFLTDQIGFAAGIEILPETRIAQGVVCSTRDGGRSWSRIDSGTLPGLQSVHFFDLDQGCAAGQSTALCPSGLWTTADGGHTWTTVPGRRSDGWSATAFTQPGEGALVGERNQLGTIGNGILLPTTSAESLRGLHDVLLQADGRGWLVGDGATLLTTIDSGNSWPDPPGLLPDELSAGLDFHTVAAQGDRVWAAGAPGSVIWHSPDAGRSWQPQPTGDAACIRGIAFADAQRGVAVGLFGSIRLTENGGNTWTTIRGGGRRAAFLVLQARPDQCHPLLTTRDSGEQGYRSVNLVVTRSDIGPQRAELPDAAERLRAASLAAGGNDVIRDWRLPLDAPELERQYDDLVAAWSRRHEQRLPQVLLGGLVAAIRTYQPDVVICDEAATSDAVTRLLNEALPLAVAQAADATRFPEHRTLLELAPWTVSKTFQRTLDPQAGTLAVDPHQILPRRGQTLQRAAREAASCAFTATELPLSRVGYRLTHVAPSLAVAAGDAPSMSPLARSLFAGLSLAPDTAARRPQPLWLEVNDDELAARARHQRNFEGFARQCLDDPGRAAQLIAQLRESTAPLPPADAALLLAGLAEEYRQRSQWELMEDVCVQLVEQYPDQPTAQSAMRWLLARWTSQEVLWSRLRTIASDSPQTTIRPEIVQAGFEQALEAATAQDRATQLAAPPLTLPSPEQTLLQRGSVRTGGLATLLDQSGRNLAASPAPTGANQMHVEMAQRWQQAQRMSTVVRTHAPALATQTDMQFISAALLRATGTPSAAAEVYRGHFGLDESLTPWNSTARGELWMQSRGPISPKPVWPCRRTVRPPVLDGRLDEACWRVDPGIQLAAKDPLPLDADPNFVGDRRLPAANGSTELDTSDTPQATVQLACDAQYLYLAATLARESRLPVHPVQQAGRTHDADLQGHDRLSIAFDVDRDYATWYRFEIDERGWTREALWEDQRWNPEWFVAAVGDAGQWQFEAAIPWEELAPSAPQTGTVWAAGITRVLPGVGLQAWTHPASPEPRGETFGLVQFD